MSTTVGICTPDTLRKLKQSTKTEFTSTQGNVPDRLRRKQPRTLGSYKESRSEIDDCCGEADVRLLSEVL